MSFVKKWDISGDIEYAIGECKGMIDVVKGIPLEPEMRSHLLQVALIKGAMATTAIEGNTLSEEEVEGILNGKSVPESRRYMEIEVKNVIDALNVLLKEVIVDEDIQLVTPQLILRFHKMIGQNLGEHLEAIPGQFRKNNVVVGNYRGPEYKEVQDLMKKLCEWLRAEFHFEEHQSFLDAIIQAIVTHVYIAWIHPFGDGNGRTARLLEFYLLLRWGLPDFASHILSNFYNQTRTEYYRQLDSARKSGDLSRFVAYAVSGLRDGLSEVSKTVSSHLLEVSWKNYVYEVFDEKGAGGDADKRRRDLVLAMGFAKEYSFEELENASPKVARSYGQVSERTVYRDVETIEKLDLVVRGEGGIRVNTDILYQRMPKWRQPS
jgi:Fic family protein